MAGTKMCGMDAFYASQSSLLLRVSQSSPKTVPKPQQERGFAVGEKRSKGKRISSKPLQGSLFVAFAVQRSGSSAAQRIYHDIDRTEQLYNCKQTDGYINCNGCAESSIAAALGGIAVAAAGMAGVAGMAGIAGVTAGETQLCIQRNRFPLRNDERSALGCGILELIGCSRSSASVEPKSVTRK